MEYVRRPATRQDFNGNVPLKNMPEIDDLFKDKSSQPNRRHMSNMETRRAEREKQRNDRLNHNDRHDRLNRHDRRKALELELEEQFKQRLINNQIHDLISGKIELDDLDFSPREWDLLLVELDRIENEITPIDSKLGIGNGSNGGSNSASNSGSSNDDMRKMRINSYRNERSQKVELIARIVILATTGVSGLASWYLGEKINDGSLKFKVLSTALKIIGGFTVIAAPVIAYMI